MLAEYTNNKENKMSKLHKLEKVNEALSMEMDG
jgi:hypothetical protein